MFKQDAFEGWTSGAIVRRLKIKRARREKRHRLQTTDMTSLACQILLLARNGSRYFYRNFFSSLRANRTTRIHRTAESMESLRFCTMYIFPRPGTFNDHFNTPRIIHPRAIKFFLFLSLSLSEGFTLHWEWEQGEKRDRSSEFVQTSTRSESSHNFTSHAHLILIRCQISNLLFQSDDFYVQIFPEILYPSRRYSFFKRSQAF